MNLYTLATTKNVDLNYQSFKKRELIECLSNLRTTYFSLKEQNQKQKEVIDKVIDKLQLLIDIGFDYDGFNQVNSLKTLIDELVGYAKESRNILKEVE